jgi:hypothetical protein
MTPRLLSNRKKVTPLDKLPGDRWEYLGLEDAMPNLGRAPSDDTGYTLIQNAQGITEFSNTLGKLEFQNQTISPTMPGTDVTIDGAGNSNIVLSPLETVEINGKIDVTSDALIRGKIRVLGEDPEGTAPFVKNTLYVTEDGDDSNDGRAQDKSRACRTISGACRSPYYTPGTTIKVASGHYFEDNPIPLKAYTSVIGNDLRTTFVEPLNKDLDLFHVNSGVYIAQMQMRNLRRGSVERYAPGGAGTYTTGAYCTAFPPNLENPIDVYYSPYIQNCTNQSGPWLFDGTMFVPNQTVQIPAAAGTSSWVANIYTLTVHVATGTIEVGMAVNDSANEGYRNAQLLLKANKAFLQNEVVAYVNTTYNGFYYDEIKCARDTGLIVDTIAQDILFEGFSQSNFSGIQYWAQNGYVGAIPGEISTTTKAIEYVSSLAQQVITKTTATRYQSTVTQIVTTSSSATDDEATVVKADFDVILNILNRGTEGVTDIIVPNDVVASSSTNVLGAYNLLQANKSFIQYETISYIETLRTGFFYDQAKCHRDSGLIVDAIVLDLLYPTETNSQSTFAGLQYWDQGGYTGTIASELTTTTNAIKYVNSLTQKIVRNNTTGPRYQGTVTQFTGLPAATVTESAQIDTDFKVITNILTSGTSGVTDIIVPNGVDPTTSTFINRAYNLIQANREYIIAEAIAYVESTKAPGFVYDQVKCERDVGYMLDSVSFDLLHGGNRQAVQSGVYYYTFDSASTAIPNEIPQTVDAFDFLGSLAQKVIQNVSVTPYQNTVTQVFAAYTATYTESAEIYDIINTITNIIVNGPSVISDKKPISLTTSTNVNDYDSAKLLAANRNFIQSEVVAYINQKYEGQFEYDQAKCFRDIGYMIDSVSFDLLYGGNRQAVQSGVYYYGYSTATTIPNEIPQTIAAYNYISTISQRIITGSLISPYQTKVPQVVDVVGGDIMAAALAPKIINTITNIIRNGPSVAEEPSPISLTKSSDPYKQYAANILKANREFIKAEVIAYLNGTYFVYNQLLCFRDVGFIVDAVAGDARFGGNKRSIEAGLSYWKGNESLIQGQQTETIGAIDYLETLCQDIITNTEITSTYQTFVGQTINPAYDKGQVVSTRITESFSIITDLISAGGDNEPETIDDIYALIVPSGLSPNEVNTASVVTKVTKLSTSTYEVTLNRATVGISAGATLYFGETSVYPFLDDQIPSLWTADDGNGIFADRRLNPFGSGGGALVDGNAPSLRSPIQSFVFDAFTQLNQGGIGVHIINNGYAQLVSVFTIFCSNSVLVENGGIASITNSNANFGDQCLTAKGIGALEFSGIIHNPAYPTNVENSEFYPLGYWPRNQSMEIFVPDTLNRPHIGLVMEVQAPDTYIDYEGRRVPYINEQGFPGYLVVTSNTGTVRTGSYTIDGIDVTNIAVGHTIHIRDIYGEEGPATGLRYVTSGTQVVDVNYQSITLDRPILNGGGDPNNLNFLNLYFCGNAYYTVLSSVVDTTLGSTVTTKTTLIPGEESTTSQAIIFARDLALQLIANQTVTPYQTDVAQAIDLDFPNGADASDSLADKFNIIADIVKKGSGTGPEVIPPRQYIQPAQGFIDAKRLLEKNRNFIQAETVAFVDFVWPSKFTYDPAKCSRDTGLIVDALAQDLLFNTSSQSTFAGIQYWNQNGTVIGGEETTTTNAIKFLKETSARILKNQTTGTKYFTGFKYDSIKCQRDTGLIVDAVIQDALFSTSSQSTFAGLQYWAQGTTTIPNEVTTTSNAIKYISSLTQQIILAQTGTRYQSTFTQNVSLTSATTAEATLVATDFKIVTDIIAAGTAGVSDKIVPNSLTTSTNTNVANAYNIIIANRDYIQREAIAYVESTKTSGFTYDSEKCFRDMGFIVDSIAFDLLYGGNRQAIQSGVYYYGFTTTSIAIPGEEIQTVGAFNYIRDLMPWIVRGITTATYQNNVPQVINMSTGTLANATTIQNNITTITNIINSGTSVASTPSPIPLTASTSTSLRNAVDIVAANKDFIKAETTAFINKTYKAQPFQLTSTNTVTNAVIDTANTDFQLIIDILSNGVEGVTDRIVPNALTSSTNVYISNAYSLLQRNKDYITREVVAYVNSTSNFTYDQAKCLRDTGLIVDAIAFDLKYPSTKNSQSTFAGIQYWNQRDYVGTIANEITTTTDAVIYLSSLAQQVVVNSTATRYQTTVTQITTLPAASGSEAAAVGNNFGVVIDILTTGTTGVTDIIVPNGQPSNSVNINKAYDLLLANKQFMLQETLAYIDDVSTVGFTYDRTKCYRDLGYILDSIAFDLVHGGNRQAVQSGVYYYGFVSTSSAVAFEVPQTTAAYDRISNIVTDILLGNEVTKSPGNTATQVTYMTPATISEINLVKTYINTITNIINNGPAVAQEPTPISLTQSSNPNVDKAFDLLTANRRFIQEEVIAYVNSQFCGFTYDEDKCFRDVGYMLDSVSFDLLHGGNRQAIQSGVYYYDYDASSTAIEGEIPQTTAAYEFIKDIVEPIIKGQPISAPQQSFVKQVETLNYTYPESKCYRDTGILVDSFIIDLAFADNGLTQSNFAGLQYWNQNGYTGTIASELTTTTNAVKHLSNLAQQVVVNNTGGGIVRYNTTATQDVSLPAASYDQLYAVKDDFKVITDILTNGTAGITDKIVANGTTATSADAQLAYDILIANKTYLQQQTLAWVELNKSLSFDFDRDKCYRDVGYMVDGVAFDILHGGNRQAIQSGVYYYSFSSTSTAIPSEIEQTVAAYNRLRTILPQIVQNQTVTPSPYNTATQVTTLAASTASVGTSLEGMVDLITGIITTGPDAGYDPIPVSLTATSTATILNAVSILEANRTFIQEEIINYVNHVYLIGTDNDVDFVRNNIDIITNIIGAGPTVAPEATPIPLVKSNTTATFFGAELLNANREFIKAEVIAYVNNKFNTGFLYDKTKCKRDTRLIVDSIALDILHEGNTQSAFAGSQYWNQNGYTGDISNEITTTTNAFRYMKEVIEKIVTNETVIKSAGNTLTQIANVSVDLEASSDLTSNMDVVINIIANGTGSVTDIIEPNSTVTTSTGYLSAYNSLVANTNFIKQEVIKRIEADNNGWVFDTVKCKRDIGYVLDCVAFDMMHGGNRQSIQAGVYYYGFDAESSAIEGQTPQTTAAYDYIRSIMSNIILGTPLTTTYQKKVYQVTDLPVGSSVEVTAAQTNVDLITTIINDGPSSAPTPEPIRYVASTSTNKLNAFNMLVANRAFIAAEVVAYVDNKFTGASNYDKNKCYRDTGAIVDAVTFDMVYGGNYRSVNTGEGYFSRKGQYHIVKLENNVTDPTLFIDGASVNFYQQSYISASGYLFEYVGAGTQYGALPQVGKADPNQSKETIQLNNGKVFFTSTDQNGDFRIGPTLVISQATGVLSGRTFEKSLYASMTPFILVVGA